MQFYFIRHGQSSNNALWLAKRCSEARCADPGLTRLGRDQAKILASFLCTGDPLGGSTDPAAGSGFRLTHLYSSLMVRSAATGWILSRKLNLPLRSWEDAHEEGGIFIECNCEEKYIGQPGKNRAYFESRFPGMLLPETLGEAGWWNCRPYEEPEACAQRARRFVETLLERHGDSDDRVAVVSHLGFYNYVLAAILCGESRRVWAMINNAGIARIDFHSGLVDIVYLNRTDFIPSALLT